MRKPTDDEVNWALAETTVMVREALESVEPTDAQWKIKLQDYPEQERGLRTTARYEAQTALAFLRAGEPDRAAGHLAQAVRNTVFLLVQREAEAMGRGLYEF